MTKMLKPEAITRAARVSTHARNLRAALERAQAQAQALAFEADYLEDYFAPDGVTCPNDDGDPGERYAALRMDGDNTARTLEELVAEAVAIESSAANAIREARTTGVVGYGP